MQADDHSILPKLKQIPAHLISIRHYEQEAKQYLSAAVWANISSGAGDEISLANNQTAFDNIEISPRVLQSFANASTAMTLLGKQHKLPFLIAPIAHQQLLHSEGELATVAAVNALGVGMIAATLSSLSMEQIAAQAETPLWFQLYFQAERSITIDLVRRAEQSGYQAIVVTVDAPISGVRNRMQQAGLSLPDNLISANLSTYSVPDAKTLNSDQSIILHGYMTDAPTWEDIIWLRQQTHLPILLKGILSPADAIRARDIHMDGVIVSNHGGRTLDGLPASIECLADIRVAVGADFLLLLDSGIRRGGDIFKALALGANAVLIGRPYLYGLAIAGALGVAHSLKILKEEFEITMALAGCASIAAITPQHIKEG